MSAQSEVAPPAGLGLVLRAEWIKLRTVRGWVIGLMLAGLMVVLFTFLQANGMHAGYCTTPNPDSCVTGHQLVPVGPGGEAVSDTYRFVSRPLTGDGTITARVTALTGRIWTGPANEAPSLAHTRPGLVAWAKAGLLITSGTTQGAPYAAVMATGSHGVGFQYDFTHDEAGLPGPVGGVSSRWLRLIRVGNTITGYDSLDDVTWHKIASARLPDLPNTVRVGLFATSPVTSQGLATQASARFDHVATTPRAQDLEKWSGQTVGGGPRGSYTTLGDGGDRQVGGRFTVSGSGDIAPAVALAGGDTLSDSLLFGLLVAMIVVIVVSTMFITGEYRRGLIRTTFAATPHRSRVLLAKAMVIGLSAFVIGAVFAGAATPLAEHVMKHNGNYIFPASTATWARVIVGTGALVALTAIAALAMGTILRRSAVTILISVVIFVLPTFTGPGIAGPGSASSVVIWLFRVTPAAGFSVLGLLPRSSLVSYPYTMTNGYYPLAPWTGLLVLCAWVAATLLAARFVLARRDA